jgi:hypothetical protein
MTRRAAPLFFAICVASTATVGAQAQVPVTLASQTSPANADPTFTNVHVTGKGFPSGTIPAANVVVRLAPVTAGGGPSVRTKALAVTVVSGTTERITFRVPAAIAVTAPTQYQVAINGATSTGTTFKSSNTSAFTINPPLVISTGSTLPPGTVGMSYSQTLAATGGNGPYTWSVTAGTLPSGLTLNPTTGQLSGVPGSAGASNFTIQVADTVQGTAAVAFALTINPPVQITTNSPLPTGVVNVLYGQTLAATGGSGQYAWSVSAGTLPGGLSLNPATGQISGTPTTAGTANFPIQATDTNLATATKPFGLTINPPPQITSVSPNSGNAGLALAVTITGSYTNFVQGTTMANFGPGIAVGGAAEGQPGPITVNSPTSATAHIAIDAAATAQSQTVTVTTGSETASLTGGFTIQAAIPFLTVDTTSPTTIATGISGFQDEYTLHGVEYNDPKYVPMVQGLKPGWIRYPGGITTMAFDWQTAHENTTWMAQLSPNITAFARAGLKQALILTQGKGGACFVPGTCYADFATFAQTLGVPAVVDFNGFSDNHPNSAANMVQAAQTAGVNVIEWELANEAFIYTGVFPTATAYASAMNAYATNIFSVNAAAPVGLFYQGQFDFWPGTNYQTWDAALSAVSPRYWPVASTHVYPITNPSISTTDEEQQLNGFLAHGTAEYVASYLAPAVGLNTPIFITETNSDGLGSMVFETYMYNGVFLAEYVARMSAVPNVKAIGVATLYLGNSFDQGMIRAVNDYESYLSSKVRANPSFSTNTATDPNTQFSFYYSVSGLCMQVVNQAVNDSNAVWPTVVNGGPTVPIQGYDGLPIPAVYAQAYQGVSGKHYLLVTNKSGTSIQLGIEVNGELLPGSVTITSVSNSSDVAANTATNQTNVQVASATSANPVTVGPYSVTRIEW